MPIFEYRCEACGHKFEAILFGQQTPECPNCHTEKLEKQLSTFAVSKGSSAASPEAGCGQTNCCRMNGGCELN
jgi:putative FmdB family regulatory protein